MVTAALSTVPSLTTSWTTHAPATSGVNVGFTVVAPASVAALPGGLKVNDQLKVSESSSASRLPLPLRAAN